MVPVSRLLCSMTRMASRDQGGGLPAVPAGSSRKGINMSPRLPLSIVSSLVMLMSAPYTFGQQARTAEGDVGKKVYQRVLKSVVCVLPLKGSKAVGVGSG